MGFFTGLALGYIFAPGKPKRVSERKQVKRMVRQMELNARANAIYRAKHHRGPGPKPYRDPRDFWSS